MSKFKDDERLPGFESIPDPASETPSSTDMIEDILEEGSKIHKEHEEERARTNDEDDEDFNIV
ncbi:hypothetical protein [Paenibacillus pini]|uniref:Uncharacterized protein n=1 Tax=Paenibacillus pini JCM 16418 TaxID=1236976 RepID=W7YXL5_9BACL|nr:hypothetical protein [Paenibacillus pini]GAF07129.1 hypothetical protein JCM16418_1119 [Paenibacillus pini JCM 16418]